jgi:uncharacterized protein (TIGR02594 family)
MAKKGERVGAMGDSVYYRTPDGQIIDDSGNVLKGPMAKMLADEYESKQQEKAKAQEAAKAAAEESKRQAAAAKSAEIARKAAEREAAQRQRQEQIEARKQEAQSASDARRQQAETNRQRTSNVKQSAPPKQTQQAPAADAPQSTGDKVKGAFKEAAMNAGATAFNAAFPSFAIKPQGNAAAGGGGGGASDATDGSVRQAVNRVADEVNTTNMMMQTSIARQEMTNQLLGSILKEVQQIKKPSLIDAAADALSGLGGGKGKASSKVAPKSGMLGAAGSVLRRAPVIGALLGGGLSGYDEYQESGNAGRAVSTGAGAAAGGGLGAWGGATAGAALGAFGGPVGMAIGGLLGAVGGGLGGSWLGSKAGKGAYDMLAPGPGASADIKEAQATKLENKDIKNPTDSIVNVKTLTFNAENLVFNSKNQQGVQPNQGATNTNTSTTPAGDAKPSAAASSLPSPGGSGGPGIAKILETKAGSNTVELADGSVEKRTGARNWRNNNPGNLEYGAFSKSNGAIGTDGRFAIFPTLDSGNKAQEKLLFESSSYKNLSVSQAISKYAPPNENNTGNYINTVAAAAGVSPNTQMGSLNAEQRKALLAAMHKVEGFKEGKVETLKQGTGSNNSQVPAAERQPGGGTNTIEAARQQASASGSQSFGVTPGQSAPARVQPNQQVAALGNNGPSAGGPPNATAVQLAETMVGKNRNQSLDFLRAGGYNNQGEAWCAQFVNSSLKQSGASGSGSAVANSFQNFGSGVDPSQIQPGDVVLQTRGKGPGQTGGHVGIATGVYRNGQVEMIAGNSSGAVRKYMVPVNSQLMVRRGGGTQLAGGDKNKTDSTVGGTPGALTPSTGSTSAQLSPKESQTLQTAALQPAGSSKGAELGQASTKDMADQRSAKQGITVNQNTMSTPTSDSTKGKYSSGDVGIVEPVDARLRLKELFGMTSFG